MCHSGAMPGGGSGTPRSRAPVLPIPIPDLLARTPAERAVLRSAAERIWRRAREAAEAGAKPVVLGLRRVTDSQGRRLWAVHEERDAWLPYASVARRFCEFRPNRRAKALLAYVAALVGDARRDRPAGAVGANVLRFPG